MQHYEAKGLYLQAVADCADLNELEFEIHFSERRRKTTVAERSDGIIEILMPKFGVADIGHLVRAVRDDTFDVRMERKFHQLVAEFPDMADLTFDITFNKQRNASAAYTLPDGTLQFRFRRGVPLDIPYLRSYLRSASKTLRGSVEQVRARFPENASAKGGIKHTLADGSTLRWLGEEMTIRSADGPVERVRLTRGIALLVPDASPEERRTLIQDWYTRQADAWLARESPRWIEEMGLSGWPPKVQSRDFGRRRLGLFHYGPHLAEVHTALFQLGPEQPTQTLVHELAHALRPAGRAHGRQWQAIMDKHLPDWRAIRAVERTMTLWYGDLTPQSA